VIEPSAIDGVNLWEVPNVWKGETLIIVAPGPSAEKYNNNALLPYKEEARIIAVNDAYKLVPFADVLYGCDWWWWQKRKMVPEFDGLKIGLTYEGITGLPYSGWAGSKEKDQLSYQLASTGKEGLELEDKRAVRTGQNSGYQAINLAVNLGADRIILLGFDMKSGKDKEHFWGDYEDHPNPNKGLYKSWLKNFKTMVKPLEKAGVQVINCTEGSALKCFPMCELERAI